MLFVRAKFLEKRAESPAQIMIRFSLFGLKIRSDLRFLSGTVLIFFSLLRRFFLDIDVA